LSGECSAEDGLTQPLRSLQRGSDGGFKLINN
jgi:hypothetical protein